MRPGLTPQGPDLEIFFSDGYCQVLYQGRVIGSNDISDTGGWDKALEIALNYLKENDAPNW